MLSEAHTSLDAPLSEQEGSMSSRTIYRYSGEFRLVNHSRPSLTAARFPQVVRVQTMGTHDRLLSVTRSLSHLTERLCGIGSPSYHRYPCQRQQHCQRNLQYIPSVSQIKCYGWTPYDVKR